jgi:hypothetical protein
MKISKKINFLFFLAVFALVFVLSGIKVNRMIEWRMARELIASGGFPLEMGLVNATAINCVTSGYVCTGGTLCSTLDSGRCSTYSDVSGSPAVALEDGRMIEVSEYVKLAGVTEGQAKLAGMMPSNALFSQMAISQSGLMTCGQLIAAGMSPTMMDSGPLASCSGCANCMAGAGPLEQFKAKLRVFSAMVKEKIF